MAALLTPLAERIEKHVLAGAAIHTDDMVVLMLSPGLKRIRKGRVWAHLRNERPWGSVPPPAVFYKYSSDRKGAFSQKTLDSYDGFLRVDGYSGYGKLFKKGKVKEAACMAHSCRKVFDIHKADASPIAENAARIHHGVLPD